MAKEKRFSKEKWLAEANAQMAQGFLSQREIDDACKIWVDKFDGKTKSEIGEDETMYLSDKWFV